MARSLGGAVARATSIPSPVGGLNDRDPLADMPDTDAVILDNWWPQPSVVRVRNGCVPWATGFVSPVQSLIEYCPPSGNNQLFAASNGKVFDITLSGSIGAPVMSDLSSDQWQSISMTTAGGSFLYLLNGKDHARLYDGTTWKTIDGASTPAITGVDTSLLVQGCLFKNRIFFTERNSMRVWYLPVLQIGGAATSVDFGSIFQRGGAIAGVYSWTIDAGAGVDDHAVIISTSGEVAVYSGTDPGDVANWSLVGVFFIGRPIGRRCAIKFGGDLLLLCELGIYPISKALLSSSVDRRDRLNDKIQNSVNTAINAGKDLFGWEMCLYPAENALILNVPTTNGNNYQFPQNTISQAWTKFVGWNAQTFANTALGLYYGSTDTVFKAWTGNIDNDVLIVGDALQAFSPFKSPAFNKYFTMVNPFIRTDGTPAILYDINGDYVPKNPTGVLNYTQAGGMIWGSMVWGSMVWGGSLQQLSGWNTVGGIYKAAGLRMKVQSNISNVEWAATSFTYSLGGLL